MADLACPQCDKPLVALQHAELRGDACHDCGGIWLSSDVTTRVGRALGPTAVELGEEASALATNPYPSHVAAPPCPECGTAMQAFVVPTTEIEVDTCTLHGTWLDRGELETMVRALATRKRAILAAATNVGPAPLPTPVSGEVPWTRADSGYVIDAPPTLANQVANDALDVVENVAVSVAIDIVFDLLGSLLSSRRN